MASLFASGFDSNYTTSSIFFFWGENFHMFFTCNNSNELNPTKIFLLNVNLNCPATPGKDCRRREAARRRCTLHTAHCTLKQLSSQHPGLASGRNTTSAYICHVSLPLQHTILPGVFIQSPSVLHKGEKRGVGEAGRRHDTRTIDIVSFHTARGFTIFETPLELDLMATSCLNVSMNKSSDISSSLPESPQKK